MNSSERGVLNHFVFIRGLDEEFFALLLIAYLWPHNDTSLGLSVRHSPPDTPHRQHDRLRPASHVLMHLRFVVSEAKMARKLDKAALGNCNKCHCFEVFGRSCYIWRRSTSSSLYWNPFAMINGTEAMEQPLFSFHSCFDKLATSMGNLLAECHSFGHNLVALFWK